jgi:hypothetical protein
LANARAHDQRDELVTLLTLHDLSMAPLSVLGDRVRWQGHPAVVGLKWQLETRFEAQLDASIAHEPQIGSVTGAEAAAAMRQVAARDRCPAVYDWIAEDATWSEVVQFLAIEGGPDAGFDDLVAICQVGLAGSAKVALADNYWDEMGRGQLGDVHTLLHDRLVEAIDMPRIARCDLPLSALRRAALGGLLATNRRLQPEMLGALGLLELQAGPRCRQVVRAFERLGCPDAAMPFYEVHARDDPRHGKDWLDLAIVPLVDEQPDWGPRIVRGARWRAAVNRALFDQLHPHASGAAA